MFTSLYSSFFLVVNDVREAMGCQKLPLLGDKIKMQLDETMHSSYWNQYLGKPRDPVPTRPIGLDVETHTFGLPSTVSEGVADLVNPRRSPEDLKLEKEIDKILYKCSPRKWQEGEQLTRNYVPPYDKCTTFGRVSNRDYRGTAVSRAISWFTNEPLTTVHEIQAAVLKRKTPRLGTALQPNQYVGTRFSEDHTFGLTKLRDIHQTDDALRESPIDFQKEDQMAYLAHINHFRRCLKNKNPPFPFEDLYEALKDIDEGSSGWLPLDAVNKVCLTFDVKVNEKLVKDLMCSAGLVNEKGEVQYSKFIEIIDYHYEFPALSKINDVPPEFLHYETSYCSDRNDWRVIDNSVKPAAGLPSARLDLPYPKSTVKSELDNLGDETNVWALVSPSLYTQYGLSHRDFFLPRTKEQMQSIFKNIGVTLPDDVFNELWEEAYCVDRTGGVCVETFRNRLEERAWKEIDKKQAKALEIKQKERKDEESKTKEGKGEKNKSE